MSDIVFQQELFNQLRHDTFHYMRDLMEEERSKPALKWVTNKVAMQLLDACPRTMQNWRDDGVIGFSQVGNKIYYSQEDLDLMLQRHYHKPFKAVA